MPNDREVLASPEPAQSASADYVEHITSNGTSLAYIIKAAIDPKVTTFLTPSELKQQVGFVVYPAGGEVKRHVHRALERHLVGTSEVIIVRKGRCEIDIYNDDRQLVASREILPQPKASPVS